MKPESYWEKRCTINENVLERLMRIVEEMAPAHFHGDGIFDRGAFSTLRDHWQEAIDELDAGEES